MAKTYVVIGAGLQGTAAAFDFGRFGDAGRIILADLNRQVAAEAAARVNRLLENNLVAPAVLDVRNHREVQHLLQGADVCLSAVPYSFNVELTRAAIAAECHFCDLGGNTEVVFKQHDLSEGARQAGISVAPDCGLAPGMANILAVYGMRRLQQPRRVRIYVGGLPQEPKPPLGYALYFNIGGLTNEYFGRSYVLQNGAIAHIDAFSDPENIEFPAPLGQCEAFITVGGTSTCPWTFEGVLDAYFEKTVRYPGHYDKMKAIYDLGLLDEQPVRVGEVSVAPRQVFHAVVGPRLASDDPRDVVALRVIVEGDDGTVEMNLLDFYDAETGFTAMQRTTGFGAAIVGIMQANGAFPPGSIRLEQAVDPENYVAEMQKRGFVLEVETRAA